MIDIQHITKSFGSLQVLKGISLHIDRSEVVSIVGPSGAGKTTLLQIIGTLDRPDSGTVSVDAVDVTTLSQRQLADFRNRHLGFVFQFHQLLPEFTALENIMIPAYIAGTNQRKAKERAQELLQFMQLTDRAHHKPAQLSGGEKQRIAIARAILKNAPIVVLDEATAYADAENEAKIQKAFSRLSEGKTVIMIAHRLKTVRSADRILVIDSGKIAQQGTHDELMRQDGIYRTFVDSRREAASWRL